MWKHGGTLDVPGGIGHRYRTFTSACTKYIKEIPAYVPMFSGPRTQSQAARQGLAVLMASAVVVLIHETSTLRQRHTFISIDLIFGVSDYVREVTNKDGSGPVGGRDATWGQHIRVL